MNLNYTVYSNPTVLTFPLDEESLDLGLGGRGGPAHPGGPAAHGKHRQVVRAAGGLWEAVLQRFVIKDNVLPQIWR